MVVLADLNVLEDCTSCGHHGFLKLCFHVSIELLSTPIFYAILLYVAPESLKGSTASILYYAVDFLHPVVPITFVFQMLFSI